MIGRVQGEVARRLRVDQQRVYLATYERVGDVVDTSRHGVVATEPVLESVGHREPFLDHVVEERLPDRLLERLVPAVVRTGSGLQLDNRGRRAGEPLAQDRP